MASPGSVTGPAANLLQALAASRQGSLPPVGSSRLLALPGVLWGLSLSDALHPMAACLALLGLGVEESDRSLHGHPVTLLTDPPFLTQEEMRKYFLKACSVQNLMLKAWDHWSCLRLVPASSNSLDK